MARKVINSRTHIEQTMCTSRLFRYQASAWLAMYGYSTQDGFTFRKNGSAPVIVYSDGSWSSFHARGDGGESLLVFLKQRFTLSEVQA